MKKRIWLEWIGVWGSGKSTAIKSTQHFFLSKGYKLGVADDYNILGNRSKRFLFYAKILFKRPYINLRMFIIIFPFYLKLKLFEKNSIMEDMIKSFCICWMKRQICLSSDSVDYVLWEGEFHLLPFLTLSFKKKSQVIKLILELDQSSDMKFILHEVDFDTAMERITNDQIKSTNVRFKSEQYKIVADELIRFIWQQKRLIALMNQFNLNFLTIREIMYELK